MVPDCILKLMDFSKEYADLAYTEFIHKYTGSFLKINNKHVVILVKGTNTGLFTETINIPLNKITSIEPVFPKIGLYTVYNSLVYVYKYAKRQYTKGCAPKRTHNFTLLEYNDSTPISFIDILENGQYLGEYCIFENKLYYRWLLVGNIVPKENKINIKLTAFKPEIEELWNKHLKLNITSQSQTRSPFKKILEPLENQAIKIQF